MYNMKLQLNTLGDFMRGNTIDNMLHLISLYTDDRGMAKQDEPFADGVAPEPPEPPEPLLGLELFESLPDCD